MAWEGYDDGVELHTLRRDRTCGAEVGAVGHYVIIVWQFDLKEVKKAPLARINRALPINRP